MLAKELLYHQWLKTVRAPGFYRNVIVNIFFGLFALYFLVLFAIVGFFLPDIIVESSIPYEPLEAVCGFFVYYMITDIAVRYFMQPLNTLQIVPYQILPIKRKNIVNYLLYKPLLNPVNYSILLILLPFGLRSLFLGSISALQFSVLILVSIFTVWFCLLLATYLKRRLSKTMWGTLFFFAGSIVIGALEYFKIFSLFEISRVIFQFLINTPFAELLMLLAAAGAFVLGKQFFSKNYYSEQFNQKTEKALGSGRQLGFLQHFGIIGEFITLDIKLILRHKRTKSVLYIVPLFLFYGLIFYTNDMHSSNNGMLYFVAMFVTGVLMLMFGQWIINWDGTHFDCLMTQPIDSKTYLRANYYLLIAFNIITFILTTPYFFMGSKIIYLHISAFLYNCGVNVLLFLITSTFNNKRLDLSKGGAMNYQGTTYKNFLFVLPMMFFPWIFMAIMSHFDAWKIGAAILGFLGILGMLFHNPLLNLVTRLFLQRKYTLAEGFRKKES